MTDTTSSNVSGRSPWGRAFREARAIVAVAFVIAVTYNLLAATRIPWIREPRKPDTAVAAAPALADTNAGMGADTGAGTMAVKPADTGATPLTASVKDTADTGAALMHSPNQATIDSVNEAKRLRAAAADSARKAETAALITKAASQKEINSDIAKRLFDAKAVFIDARPEDHFAEGHIRGAMNVYAEQWQTMIPELLKIPKDAMIVTYCGGGDECELSHELADHLREIGFTKVTVYHGGIKEWTARNYPVVGTPK